MEKATKYEEEIIGRWREVCGDILDMKKITKQTFFLHGKRVKVVVGLTWEKESTRDWETIKRSKGSVKALSVCVFMNASKPSSREGIKTHSYTRTLSPPPLFSYLYKKEPTG